jgi:DNA-binding response OmpR family regulator
MRQRDRKLMGPPPADGGHAEGEPTVRQSHGRPGVLVADGDHLVRIMVQLGLERNGFDVWLASNGREAIRLYRTHRERIGVVLLDVRLPDLDGPATLDALRQLHPEVLACFMGGDTGDHEPEELRQRGAAYVVAKPFLLNELANVLRLLTQGVSADGLPSGGTCQA